MNTRVGDLNIEIREGTVDDIPQIFKFICDMAEFENLPIYATEDGLREVLFGDRPAAQVLMVHAGDEPIGYANYFFTFSSMLGKRGLWLDDIYISPAYRGKKIGQVVMAYVAKIAVANDCGRFEWSVLDWNENAIQFYKKLGAKIMDGWLICRLEGESIQPVSELHIAEGNV